MAETIKATYAWALIAVLVSAFVTLFFSAQLGFFGLLFAIVGWWAWKNPEEAFLLFVVLMPILPMLKITQTIGTATLVKDVIIFVLFAKLCLIPLLTKRLPYRRNILFAPIAALALWTAVEMLRADSLILGVLRAREIGLYALLYFVVLYLPADRQVCRTRLKWFTVTVIVTLGLAVYQWLSAADSAVLRYDPVREIWIPRVSSILAHPSIYGQYLIVAATLFLALKRHWLFWLTLPAIYLTFSRAVWIGLVAGVVAQYSLFVRGKKILVPLVLAAAALIVLLRVTPAGTFVRSAIDPTYGSNVERLEFLTRLIAPMTDSEALFGKGLGDVLTQNFREVDLEAVDLAEGDARAVQLTKNRTLVDNQWLKTFVEMGLAGLLIYGWLFWRYAKGAWQAGGVVGRWALGFLAAFVIQGFFIDIWDIFPTNAIFWIIGGLVSAELTPEVKSRV